MSKQEHLVLVLVLALALGLGLGLGLRIYLSVPHLCKCHVGVNLIFELLCSQQPSNPGDSNKNSHVMTY